MLKLKEEFERLFDFFNKDEVKVENFKETLEGTVRLSEKLKDKLIYGTKEEKEEIQEFIKEMSEKVEEEKNKLFQKIGVSEEELKTFLSNKNNFSETEWNTMQDVKKYITSNAEEHKPETKPKNKSHKQWLQS
ncbi:MAG: hypothetical protein ACD_20C00252G0002 [uncultured bacterium]|nr:MAG: hypothetical protein ACD_20C00252G0002 [uncultured bacterium]